jgi:hypothetical protein
MNKIIHYCCAVLIIMMLQSCSSDDDAGGISSGALILEAIIGDWIATNAVFSSISDPAKSTDVVMDGGQCDLTVSPNQTFTLVVRNAGFPNPQITTGRFIADGPFINVRLDSDPNVDVRWDFTLSNNNLNINGPMDYDFESDGSFEEVLGNLQFIAN